MTATIRSVLAHDDDEPICDGCARALGGRPKDDVVTVSPRNCCICDEHRGCAAIRDWTWPGENSTRAAKRDWQRPL